MLKIFFGDLENEVYNPPAYFLNQYMDEWVITDLSKKMIKDIDKSEVISERIIDSPVLGAITPRELSGGVKTLMLMAYDDSEYVFNASACGDNCSKWILEIAKTRNLTITLHHVMHFDDNFEAEILNNGKLIQTNEEYVTTAIKYL